MQRRYTAEEVEAIVRLATRLQAENEGKATLEEVERAAAEFGVDPKYVHLAARHLDHVSTTSPALTGTSRTAESAFQLALTLQVLSVAPIIALMQQVLYGGLGFGWIVVNLILTLGVGLTYPRRNWAMLAAAPILATGVITAIVTFINRGSLPYNGWPENVIILILLQVATVLIGYGIARILDLLSKDRERTALGR